MLVKQQTSRSSSPNIIEYYGLYEEVLEIGVIIEEKDFQ